MKETAKRSLITKGMLGITMAIIALLAFVLCTVQVEAEESGSTPSDGYCLVHIDEYGINTSGDYTSSFADCIKSGTVRVEYLNSDGNAIPSSDGAEAVRITLISAHIYKYCSWDNGIWSELPLIINLRGDNRIDFCSEKGACGIDCEKGIEFTGDGDLKICTEFNLYYGNTVAPGIMALDGAVTFRGSGHITTEGYRAGIMVNGKLNFNLAKGGKVESSCCEKGLSAFETENYASNTINFTENNAITNPTGAHIVACNETTNMWQTKYYVVDKNGTAVHSVTVENTEKSASEDEVIEINMQPGDLINFDKLTPYNVKVIINQPGEYTVKGSTSNAHFVIGTGGSGTARVIFDGAEITPGSHANNGKGIAGITIADDGGIVELVSAAGTSNIITGYKLHPAIEKEGINTKLVFDSTATGASAGTIKAESAHDSGAPGIGGISGKCCGNISFKAGFVEARGSEGPGIGASQAAGKLDLISFDGASVTAVGSSYAPGIGTSECIEIGSITINSGLVRATAEKGAGIGGGGAYLSKEGKQANIEAITINGGVVEATSTGGCAGIGSGAYNFVKQITINGGTVIATTSGQLGKSDGFSMTSGACAIGGAGIFSFGRCTHIEINGGDITATANGSHGCGIGPGYNALGWNTINITGGFIKASSTAEDGMPIGGTQYSSSKTTYLHVNISGGTIDTATIDGQKSIGTFDSRSILRIQITGGSFNGTNTAVTPVNSNDEELGCAFINLDGIATGSEAALTEIRHIVEGIEYEDYQYGNNDIKTLDGSTPSLSRLYVWLPKSYTYADKATATVDAGGESKVIKAMYGYSYSLYAGFEEVTFKEGTTVTLHDITDTMEDGSALCGYMQKAADVLSAPSRTGYHTEAYYADQTLETLVMNEDGSFVKDVNGYTDQFGNWICNKASVTLYTEPAIDSYTVKYDANVPEGASTELSGSMDDQTFIYGVADKLRNIWDDGAYSLPGYYLLGWNMTPDATYDQAGNRTAYFTNNQSVSNLSSKNGGVVTLYAQWVPLHYYACFDGNGSTSGSMDKLKLTFDETAELTENAFVKDSFIFAGWKRTEVGSSLLADKAQIENLMTGDYLSEQWTEAHAAAKGSSPEEPEISAIMGKYDNQTSQASTIELTLTAQWKTPAEFCVQILIDDKIPDEGSAQRISLKTENTSGATEAYWDFTGLNTGYAYIDNVAPGDYYIFVDRKATNVQWSTDGSKATDMVFLQYYTYDVSWDNDNIGNASIKLAEGSPKSPFISACYKQATLVGGQVEVSASDFKEGYTFDMWNSLGVDPEDYDVSKVDNPATFTVTGTTSLRAEARKVKSYTVKYDANVPAGASTTLSGSMDDQELVIGVSYKLSNIWDDGAYSLPGYYFKEWNTKADGSGDYYTNCQEVNDLISEDGGVVTLYAQWVPLYYYVEYDGGDGASGSMSKQSLTFDTIAELQKNQYTKSSNVFCGWKRQGTDFGGTLYADQAPVENLLTGEVLSGLWSQAYNEAYNQYQREPTIAEIEQKYRDAVAQGYSPITVKLIAQWEIPADFTVQITLDDRVPEGEQTVSLKEENNVSAADRYSTTASEGYASISEVAAGTYYIFVNGKATGRTWTATETAAQDMELLQYYSFGVAKDAQTGNVSIALAEGEAESPFTGETEVTLVGAKVMVSASDFAEGYTFVKWNSLRTDPSDFTENKSLNPATFTIAGKTLLKAEAGELKKYTLVYDANDGSGDAVSSEEYCGVGGVISACEFKRSGYTFKAWNTKADGSGRKYDVGEEFLDLADAGETVTLYAIWKRQPSIIDGSDQTVSEGTKTALRFVSDAEIEEFIEVRINGSRLSNDNYDITEGSTIITLKPEYVASLDPGKYTLSIVSEAGSADTHFTVTAVKKSVDTGDDTNMIIYIVIGAAAIAIGLAALRRLKNSSK